MDDLLLGRSTSFDSLPLSVAKQLPITEMRHTRARQNDTWFVLRGTAVPVTASRIGYVQHVFTFISQKQDAPRSRKGCSTPIPSSRTKGSLGSVWGVALS